LRIGIITRLLLTLLPVHLVGVSDNGIWVTSQGLVHQFEIFAILGHKAQNYWPGC